jgi:hypothetical protein
VGTHWLPAVRTRNEQHVLHSNELVGVMNGFGCCARGNFNTRSVLSNFQCPEGRARTTQRKFGCDLVTTHGDACVHVHASSNVVVHFVLVDYMFLELTILMSYRRYVDECNSSTCTSSYAQHFVQESTRQRTKQRHTKKPKPSTIKSYELVQPAHPTTKQRQSSFFERESLQFMSLIYF